MALHVCLDARLVPGNSGGVEQVATGLMHALGEAPGDQRFSFLVYDDFIPHFQRFAGRRVELVGSGPAPLHARGPRWVRALKPLAKKMLEAAGFTPGVLPPPPEEPEVVRRLAPDVLHFNLPGAFRTSRRNLYVVYDLQYVHLPEFFTAADHAARDRSYRAFCEQATLVMALSGWGRDDLVQQFGLAPARIRVVPMAAPTDAYVAPPAEELAAARARLGISEPYAFFPAQSWPHKNHLAVVRALHLLKRDHALVIPLVLSGRRTAHYDLVEAEARRLNVAGQIRHLGFVAERDLLLLYSQARLLVFPSLFEGWGLPLTEAMKLGVPIAASEATCIPEQLGDAGLLFDPQRPEAIAGSLRRLWTDATLRGELVARGHAQVARFTWARTAMLLSAIYDELAAMPP